MSDSIAEAVASSDTPVPEAPAATSTEAAPVAEESKADPKISKAFLALQKKEAAFRAQQETWKQERASYEQEKAQIAQWKAEAEAAKKEVEAERARYRGLRENPDPIAALKEANLDYEELTRRIAFAGTADGEVAALKNDRDSIRKEIEALRGELKAKEESEKKQREEFALRQQQMAEATQLQQAQKEFVSFVDTNWEKYPNLANYDPDDIASAAVIAATQYAQQHGRPPANPGILAQQLEQIAAEKQARMKERISKRTPSSKPAAPTAKEPVSETEDSGLLLARQRAAAKRGQTLTNRNTVDTTGQKRAETREEKKARLAARL